MKCSSTFANTKKKDNFCLYSILSTSYFWPYVKTYHTVPGTTNLQYFALEGPLEGLFAFTAKWKLQGGQNLGQACCIMQLKFFFLLFFSKILSLWSFHCGSMRLFKKILPFLVGIFFSWWSILRQKHLMKLLQLLYDRSSLFFHNAY